MDVHNTIGGSLQISTEVSSMRKAITAPVSACSWRLTVLPM